MNYISFYYIFFILILSVLYYVLPKRVRYIVLLAGSIFFYYSFSKQYIFFVIISSIITYFFGRILSKYDKHKKIFLIIGILLNLSILITLKYNNFLASTINSIIGGFGLNIPYHKFVLPIGISYYTLETIGYLVDIYRKKNDCEKNFLKVLLYLVYFPKILEGPICKYKEISSSLFNNEKFNYEKYVSAFVLIAWGFFKKMVIADRAGIFVNNVFSKNYGGYIAVVAVVLYTIQIYADFSGCIDIVRGTSELFGVHLPENFRRPFFSKSIQEFWRRWHITLGAWLKEYIFFPISLSKMNMNLNKKLRKWKSKHLSKFFITAFPLLFVWITNGIWHGASWKYVIYGMYYYILMMLGVLFKPLFDKIIFIFKIKTDVFSFKLYQGVRTFIIVCFGMLIFRCDNLSQILKMFKSNATTSLLKLGIDKKGFLVLILALFVVLIVGIMQECNIDIRKKLSEQNLPFRWLIYYILIFSIIIFGIYGPGYDAQSFIYGGF